MYMIVLIAGMGISFVAGFGVCAFIFSSEILRGHD